MSLKNLFKAGELVIPVPIGVLMTLQYNRDGNLEKIYTGIKDDRTDITTERLIQFVNNGTVPSKIHITNGSTFVEGVLYTGDVKSRKSWDNPKTLYEILLDKYDDNPSMFNFFGVNIFSHAIAINGSISIHKYLRTTGFHTLEGMLLPIGDTDALIKNFVNSDAFPFLKVAMGYFTIGTDVTYIHGGVHQHIIRSIDRFNDINGYIKGKIVFKEFEMYLDYSDIVRQKLSKGTTLILDDNRNIIFSFGGKNTPSNIVSCSCCGKVFPVSETGLTQCSDYRCPSRLYPAISQFIKKLGILPEMTEQRFMECISDKSITCLSDILILPEYKDIKIHTTIASLLRALVPYRLIGTDTILNTFVNKCANGITSIVYYTDNPDRIGSDLNITDKNLNRLVCWFADSCNAVMFKDMLVSSQFVFDGSDKTFDGPPIFRGKRIYLTGDFIHGNIIDVCGILQSYAAEATLSFSTNVNCVLVGEAGGDVDEQSITIAHEYNIPVFSEIDFFHTYDIDSDLIANGVDLTRIEYLNAFSKVSKEIRTEIDLHF